MCVLLSFCVLCIEEGAVLIWLVCLAAEDAGLVEVVQLPGSR